MANDEIRKVSRDAGAGEALYDPAQETELQRKQRHKMDMDAGLRHRGDPVPAQEDVAAATIEEIRDRELRDYSCAATAEEISGWRNGWACAVRTLPITTEDEPPPKAYHKGWADGVKSAEIGIAARMSRMDEALAMLRRLSQEASITCTDAYRAELAAALSVLDEAAPALSTDEAPAKPVATACGQSDDFDEGHRQGISVGYKLGHHAAQCEDNHRLGRWLRSEDDRRQREIGDRQVKRTGVDDGPPLPHSPLPSRARDADIEGRLLAESVRVDGKIIGLTDALLKLTDKFEGVDQRLHARAEGISGNAQRLDLQHKRMDALSERCDRGFEAHAGLAEHIAEYNKSVPPLQTLAQRALNAASAAVDATKELEKRIDTQKSHWTRVENRVDDLKRDVDRLRTEVSGASGRAETAMETAKEARRVASNPEPAADGSPSSGRREA